MKLAQYDQKNPFVDELVALSWKIMKGYKDRRIADDKFKMSKYII